MITTEIITDSELTQGSRVAVKHAFDDAADRFSLELKLVAPAGAYLNKFKTFAFSFAQSVQDLNNTNTAEDDLYGLFKDSELSLDQKPIQNFCFTCKASAPYLYVIAKGGLETAGYKLTVSVTEIVTSEPVA